ncbi:MAG: sigma-70 family RNA polymerase sigma factor [Candidatus Levybacteria bacterium]|nr:sigma-70 family RNA polymerase sigma factor [Candidatus Levybacteria bacterium]
MSLSYVKRILQGDSKAVVEFYKFYSPKILAYFTKKLPQFEDAEDLTNDVFLEAIDSLSLLRKEENTLAWLYRIAHNKMVDFYRKRKIKSILLSQVPFLQIVASEINQPEFQFEKDKIRDKIEFVLHSLSLRYQKILTLHYDKKIPVKTLARIFNLSFKATESLLFRARQSFKLAYASTELAEV